MDSLGSRRWIFEYFKSHFASAAGKPSYPSSSESWASTDLDTSMREAAENAPMFISSFYNACEELERDNPEMEMPGISLINRILSDSKSGFQIDSQTDPPTLIATRRHIPIPLPDQAPSLSEKAEKIIQKALNNSQRALSEGDGRRAIRDLLWLLETVTTEFRNQDSNDPSIQGKYFNKIVTELKQRENGHQRQILNGMMNLHGYLSSPTGGGIRHGLDLKDGLELETHEAHLFCDLIRSYLKYLIAEHERLFD